MNVKKFVAKHKPLNIRHLIFGLSFAFLTLALKLFDSPNENLVESRTILAMRSIGNELLVSNNDFHTPVPPIKRLNQTTLRLKFDRDIEIDPDNLVAISMKYITSSISLQSIVNVLDAETKEVVYSYEISHIRQKDIPCLGRKLSSSSYLVDISFYGSLLIDLEANIPAISFASLSFVLLFFGFLSNHRKENELINNHVVALNGFELDLSRNQLLYNEKTIRLTDKEMKIFEILLNSCGKIISRDHLINEVWIKNGIVTDRSLDMFISRLRKKLTDVSTVQILNQRGKGYTLKIN